MNRAAPILFLISVVFIGTASPAAVQPSTQYAIKAGHILTITQGIIHNGIILVKNGKIERVGKNFSIPRRYTIIDAADHWVLPGFVDIHSHAGGEGSGDINDTVFQLNSELRILDTIALNTPALKQMVAAGVTTINHIPGSGSNAGGTGILMKTAGDTFEDVILKFPGVIKIAQAGNPERPYMGEIGADRMGMNWHLRQMMMEAREYYEKWNAYESGSSKKKPAKDLRFEHLKKVFDNELPIFAHCAWFQPIQSVFRMYHDEFGLSGAVITHGEFFAYRNAPLIKERDVYYDCGPRLYDMRNGRIMGIVTEYSRQGVENISINTDAIGRGGERLFLQAAMTVRLGHNEEKALEGITINGARILGVADRVGSIEQGKDADLAAWTGNPLDPRNHTMWVMVNGKLVYDIERDGQRY